MKKSFSKPSAAAAMMLSAALFTSLFAGGAEGNDLRISTLANARLTLADRDNGINPYDFGRNPAWLSEDFEYPWIRFFFCMEEESGRLKREFDPRYINDINAGFTGIKKLSDRQVVKGRFTYQRLQDRDTYSSLEVDPYNDPFYLTDMTFGTIEYYGPMTSVDYSFEISNAWHAGAGFDYNIRTGLKDVYTMPEITHNYFKGFLGVTRNAGGRWTLGLAFNPIRLQNRTDFEKLEEWSEVLIYSYSGDWIYEIRPVSTYTIRENMYGYETMLQAFYNSMDLQAGVLASYGMVENKIYYSSTNRFFEGYWKQETFDVKARARYAREGLPLVLGASAEVKSDDGWGMRPDFDEVLLYDNPYRLYSGGIGAGWLFAPADLTLTAEYIFNKFDIDVFDYGASLSRSSDIVQNIGRMALEKRILNIYSFRAGIEVTDFPIDRWLKMPSNMDKWRYTAGFGAYAGLWEIDLHLEYGDSRHEILGGKRQDLRGVVWFTRILK